MIGRPALLLVERPLAGMPLADAGRPGEAAAGLAATFRALRRLHDRGLAHGALTLDSVVLMPDGTAGFSDLGSAQPAAGELQRDLDALALLASGAVHVGADEAVTALRSGYAAG
ncbi:MAG: hypothetical protein JWR41_1757, partial [Modestobacter sp.]|nr:hypothetical protein [Modestobacter sp.]